MIAMFDDHGHLAELKRLPHLERRLRRFAPKLKARSIVKNGAVWYRTIDRVRPADWASPKLLIPGLAKVPRVAIDRSGAIPSHGVYAVFPPPDEGRRDLHAPWRWQARSGTGGHRTQTQAGAMSGATSTFSPRSGSDATTSAPQASPAASSGTRPPGPYALP